MLNRSYVLFVFEAGEEEGTRVNLTITYGGEDADPLKKADAISLAMIRNACEELEYSYDAEQCTVKAKLF